LITCNKISKALGKTEIVKSFSYSFFDNEAYAMTGPNGAGKTTLLRLLAGLLEIDSGELTRQGRCGWFAFRSLSLMDRLSGMEHIKVLSSVYGESHEQYLSHWKQLEGFQEMLETDLGHCSQGMKALLGLYSSILSLPETLLWDEPFSALSPFNQNLLSLNWCDFTGARTLITTHHGQIPEGFTEVAL